MSKLITATGPTQSAVSTVLLNGHEWHVSTVIGTTLQPAPLTLSPADVRQLSREEATVLMAELGIKPISGGSPVATPIGETPKPKRTRTRKAKLATVATSDHTAIPEVSPETTPEPSSPDPVFEGNDTPPESPDLACGHFDPSALVMADEPIDLGSLVVSFEAIAFPYHQVDTASLVIEPGDMDPEPTNPGRLIDLDPQHSARIVAEWMRRTRVHNRITGIGVSPAGGLPMLPEAPVTPVRASRPIQAHLSIEIAGKPYGVTLSPDTITLESADGSSYDVSRADHSCSCPSFRFRCEGIHGAECKHRAALRAVGLLPQAISPPERDAYAAFGMAY